MYLISRVFGLIPKVTFPPRFVTEARFEIAKDLAAKDRLTDLSMYGFDQQQRVELAKIAALSRTIRDNPRESPYIWTIDKFNLSEAQRIEIAKIVSESGCRGNLFYEIERYNISSEAVRLELAKRYVGLYCVPELICRFSITNQEAIEELTLLAIFPNEIKEYLTSHPRVSQEQRFAVAERHLGSRRRSIHYIDDFDIKNYGLTEEHRIAIAKIDVETHPYFFVESFEAYCITNQSALIELATSLAEKGFVLPPSLLRALSQEQRFAAAQRCARQWMHEPYNSTVDYCIQDYDLTEEQRIAIAKISLKRNPAALAFAVDRYCITNQEVLMELAISLAENDYSDPLASLLHALSQEQRFVAAQCYARQSSSNIGRFIKAYDLTEKQRIAIAKISVETSPSHFVCSVDQYGITNQAVLIELATSLAEKGCAEFPHFSRLFSIKDQAARSAIATIAAKNATFSMEDFEGFECDEKTCLDLGPSIAYQTLQRDGRLSNTKILSCCIELFAQKCLHPQVANAFAKLDRKLKACQDPILKAALVSRREKMIDMYLSIIRQLIDPKIASSLPYLDAALAAVLEYPKTSTEFILLEALKEVVSDPTNIQNYISGISNRVPSPPFLAHLLLPMLLLTPWDCTPTLKKRLISLREPLRNSLTGLLEALLDCSMHLSQSSLSHERKMALLEQALEGADPREMASTLRMITSCLKYKLDLSKEFKVPTREYLQSILFQQLSHILSIEDCQKIENFLDKYESTFGSMRISDAHMTYASGLTDEKVRKDFRRFLIAVIEGRIREERYRTDISSHLNQLQQAAPELFEKWKNSNSSDFDPITSSTIVNTDDWQDLFLFGTEARNCMNVSSSGTNKGLLSYPLDGKIRMLAIKKSDGTIGAFSMIRILFDESHRPVLFQDDVTGNSNLSHRKALNNHAARLAKQLGCPLLRPEGTRKLHSLPGPVALEYVNHLFGGRASRGEFTLSGSLVPSESLMEATQIRVLPAL